MSREVNMDTFTFFPNKVSGPDIITFSALKTAYDPIPYFFNSLYAIVGRKGYHPKCQREPTTAVTPKPKRSDYTVPKGYRPVTLLNCLGNMLAKILASHLSYIVERYRFLYQYQMDGRCRRNAVEAVISLVYEVDIGK